MLETALTLPRRAQPHSPVSEPIAATTKPLVSTKPSTAPDDVPRTLVGHADHHGRGPVGGVAQMPDSAGRSSPGRGTAHPRSWSSIVHRLTRWGPDRDQSGGQSTVPKVAPTADRRVSRDRGTSVQSADPAPGPAPSRSTELGFIDTCQGMIEAAHVAEGAVAAAVRRQLNSPGSVPPGEQLELILADRRAHQLGGDPTASGR